MSSIADGLMEAWRRYFAVMWITLYAALTLFAIVHAPKVCAKEYNIGPLPSAALKYRKPLTAEARRHWGIEAPLSLFAGQIHQESMWKPEARSKYAIGLTQFTPPTAGDMNKWYEKDLGSLPMYSPLWSMRAMVLYDKRLFDNVQARDDSYVNHCDRYAMMLSGYNGGAGWVHRDRSLTSESGGNPNKWFGNIEKFSKRADWAFKENRQYVLRIIFKNQRIYYSWGGEKVC